MPPEVLLLHQFFVCTEPLIHVTGKGASYGEPARQRAWIRQGAVDVIAAGLAGGSSAQCLTLTFIMGCAGAMMDLDGVFWWLQHVWWPLVDQAETITTVAICRPQEEFDGIPECIGVKYLDGPARVHPLIYCEEAGPPEALSL